MKKIIISLFSIFLCAPLFTDTTSDLIEASKAGDIEKVRQLIEQGVDVNSQDEYGWTALIHAAVNGESEIVSLLIQAGADVNASSDFGDTALMWAAWSCNLQTVELLIQAGADVNAKTTKGFGFSYIVTKPWSNGVTALMIASFYKPLCFNAEEMVHLLIQSGADVNARDEDGRTALIIIIIGEDRSAMGSRIYIRPDFGIINILITNGADVNIKDNYNKSALDYAREFGYSDIEQLLLEAGAVEQ